MHEQLDQSRIDRKTLSLNVCLQQTHYYLSILLYVTQFNINILYLTDSSYNVDKQGFRLYVMHACMMLLVN